MAIKAVIAAAMLTSEIAKRSPAPFMPFTPYFPFAFG
jgi:hypothetical protein